MRRAVRNQNICRFRDEFPPIAHLVGRQVERPARKLRHPWRSVKRYTFVADRIVLKVHGVSKHRVLITNSRLQSKIMITTDAEDQAERLTTEPVVQQINRCISATETICAVAAVDQDVAREYAELFMFLVRVAEDDDLHAVAIRRQRHAVCRPNDMSSVREVRPTATKRMADLEKSSLGG